MRPSTRSDDDHPTTQPLGDGSAVSRVSGSLRRAHRTATTVNAFAQLLNETALRSAERSDARRSRGEKPLPLDGIPYAVKDNFFVKGAFVTWGSRKWAEFMPDESDVAVQRLDAAGAVLIGTTVMPELAIGQTTSNEIHGVVRNPHNLRLTPGGSSGGSAAAVAAGIVPFALGTDGGGSTRAPASLTGIYGLKTALGSVPRGAGFPALVPDFQTTGVLAQELPVLTAAFDALSRREPHINMTRGEIDSLRIACFAEVDGVRCDTQVLQRLHQTADRLTDLGAKVTWIDAPYSWIALSEAWETIASVGVADAFSSATIPAARSNEGLEALARRGRLISRADYSAAQRVIETQRQTIRRRLMDFDVVLCPATLSAAWELDRGPRYSDGEPANPANLSAFTMWVNALGRAALTIPAAPFDDGRPVGIQLVEMGAGEPLLLDLAEALALRSQSREVCRRADGA